MGTFRCEGKNLRRDDGAIAELQKKQGKLPYCDLDHTEAGPDLLPGMVDFAR
jgi:hypothetical protein